MHFCPSLIIGNIIGDYITRRLIACYTLLSHVLFT